MAAATSMQIESRELNPCTIELKVKCSPEQVKTGYDKAYRRAAKHVKVPGFRPGAAPMAVLKNYVNQEAVKEIAEEFIVKDAFAAAIKEQGLTPQGRPVLEWAKVDEKAGEAEFQIKVPLEPKVELASYEGLEAQVPDDQVTEEQVEQQLETLRERRATRKKVEHRGAENGDFAVVNIQPDESEGEGRNFMTMIGQTFPQLDQLLLGMKAEESKRETVTFPENFQEKDWAGKPMSVQVTLRSLSAAELPELDEDFAKDLNAESLAELRERIRQNLAQATERAIQNYIDDQLLRSLLEQSTIHVPDTLWEGVAARREEELARDAQQEGRTLEEAIAESNMTMEELRMRLRKEAEDSVKRAVAIREIFDREGLKVTNEERAVQIQELARENRMTPEAVVDALKRSGNLGEIEFRAMHDKVLALLREKANLVPALNEPK